MADETNGTVLIGGSIANVNGIPRQNLARLRNDGSLDLSYTNSLNGVPTALIPLSNGQALVLGGFTALNGIPMRNLARFNYDGSPDLTFSPDAAIGGSIQAVAVQTNGGIILGGSFTNVGGYPYQYVARLNVDGSVDTSFVGPGHIGGGSIQGVVVQNNGQPIILGGITSVNGYSEVGAARLNLNGSLDTSYRFQAGFVALAGTTLGGTVAIQSDNRVLATIYNVVGIERINTDGTIDSFFNCPINASAINGIIVQPDGRILFGGSFSSVDGTNINNVARLVGSAPGQAPFQFLSANLYAGMFLSGNIGTDYRIEFTTNLNAPSLWTPLTNIALSNNPTFIVDPTLPRSSRFYRAVTLP